MNENFPAIHGSAPNPDIPTSQHPPVPAAFGPPCLMSEWTAQKPGCPVTKRLGLDAKHYTTRAGCQVENHTKNWQTGSSIKLILREQHTASKQFPFPALDGEGAEVMDRKDLPVTGRFCRLHPLSAVAPVFASAVLILAAGHVKNRLKPELQTALASVLRGSERAYPVC